MEEPERISTVKGTISSLAVFLQLTASRFSAKIKQSSADLGNPIVKTFFGDHD